MVNPLLEAIVNRGGFQPLSAVTVNLAITSVVMCALVAVLGHRGIGRGLRFGFAAAAVIVAAGGLSAALGLTGMPFAVLLAVKGIYCGALAYVLVR